MQVILEIAGFKFVVQGIVGCKFKDSETYAVLTAWCNCIGWYFQSGKSLQQKHFYWNKADLLFPNMYHTSTKYV